MPIDSRLETIENWWVDYNAARPHSALSDVPPQEFEQFTLHRATERPRDFRSTLKASFAALSGPWGQEGVP